MQTVAVDFDETIHKYTNGWTGAEPDDEPPIPGAREFLRALKMKGYRIVIFSVRASEPGGVAGIQRWLTKYKMIEYVSGVTDIKPKAIAYVDDRAVHCDGNWLAVINQVEKLAKRKRKPEPPKP